MKRMLAIILTAALASPALAQTAPFGGVRAVNVHGGAAYGTFGLSAEFAVPNDLTGELGVSGARGVTVVGGVKSFVTPRAAEGLFFAGRGSFSTLVGLGATATAGYRFAFSSFQFDVEGGLSVSRFGVGPTVGISAGYRF